MSVNEETADAQQHINMLPPDAAMRREMQAKLNRRLAKLHRQELKLEDACEEIIEEAKGFMAKLIFSKNGYTKKDSNTVSNTSRREHRSQRTSY